MHSTPTPGACPAGAAPDSPAERADVIAVVVGAVATLAVPAQVISGTAARSSNTFTSGVVSSPRERAAAIRCSIVICSLKEYSKEVEIEMYIGSVQILCCARGKQGGRRKKRKYLVVG